MMRAKKQGPYQASRFKIEISTKIFGYSVEIDLRKKGGGEMNGFYGNVNLIAADGLK